MANILGVLVLLSSLLCATEASHLDDTLFTIHELAGFVDESMFYIAYVNANVSDIIYHYRLLDMPMNVFESFNKRYIPNNAFYNLNGHIPAEKVELATYFAVVIRETINTAYAIRDTIHRIHDNELLSKRIKDNLIDRLSDSYTLLEYIHDQYNVILESRAHKFSLYPILIQEARC